ncbi:MAG: glycosyltransferase family 2 protein [Candidatus Tyrphobacter sp.]
MKATIQLCTYNRAPLLVRVLDACFEQTVPEDSYEVVLVNDGSTDDTRAEIDRARARATCAFEVVTQANAGLARARNAGIALARGERIVFIDDDVLPLPNFVEEHLRAAVRDPSRIVRGGAITVESFDDLPPPVWSLRDYSANYFWTTNVSVPLQTLRNVGGFNPSFAEYGWEDIDVGLRLRRAGVRATFDARALVYHYKARPLGRDVETMIRQARAQARTAVQLGRLHRHWRATLATGEFSAARALHGILRGAHVQERLRRRLSAVAADRPLSNAELRAARRLVKESYFQELERARGGEGGA